MAEVQMKVGGVLAEALARGRERYNAKFAEASLSGARVDEGEVGRHLVEVIGPIADAVAIVAPERVDPTVEALFDLSLDLLGRELLGNEGPIDDAWQRLLPAVPVAIASAPRRVVGAMSNAIHNLDRTPGVRTDFWLDEVVAMGSLFRTGDEILSVGQVVAWRSGMAHLRRVALDVVESLRPELATGALGIDYGADVHEVVERLRLDAWTEPKAIAAHAQRDDEPRIRARVGAFRGFGGMFHTPPTVVLVDGLFLVGDDESTWVLSADCFGATLTRTGLVDAGEEIYDPDPDLRLTGSGTVHAGAKMKQFEELAGATSWASNDDTLVATLPYSHVVRVVGVG